MSEILAKARAEMLKKGWDLYLLPRTDEHQSEYLCETDERLCYLSGFSGSNGIALFSQTEALVWTDGRYFLQAEKELYPGWQMRKLIAGEKTWFEHVVANYAKGSKLGVDPRLLTAAGGIIRSQFLQEKGIVIDLSIDNLVDLIWEERPRPQHPQIYLHEQWAGRTMSQKIAWVRDNIKKYQGNAAIFNDLAQIAWLLNLRSSQIPCNPFFKGVLIVRKQGGTLYLPTANPFLSSEIVKQHLAKEGIKLEPYQPQFQEKCLIEKGKLNFYLYSSIKDKHPIEWNGIGLFRAVRMPKEVQGFRNCHIRDGVAMVKFWAWRSKLNEVDEYEAAKYLNNLRGQQQLNKGLSFETISGGGPNGAIIHYHPTEKNSSIVTKNMIHLVDSGGQYLDGTTDCTRAFNFGTPTPEEKDSYTRVLLGNLDIQRLTWPAGKLTGGDVDILARRYLWGVGKEYNHGTGHGVGHFLGVHQGPVGISSVNKTKFQANMIVTNQPGYYQPGKYGIRIQNILLVQEKDGFNWFDNLTHCPYDRNLISLQLLRKQDRQFIDKYHQKLWNVLSPRLEGDQETLAWLKYATAPL